MNKETETSLLNIMPAPSHRLRQKVCLQRAAEIESKHVSVVGVAKSITQKFYAQPKLPTAKSRKKVVIIRLFPV